MGSVLVASALFFHCPRKLINDFRFGWQSCQEEMFQSLWYEYNTCELAIIRTPGGYWDTHSSQTCQIRTLPSPWIQSTRRAFGAALRSTSNVIRGPCCNPSELHYYAIPDAVSVRWLSVYVSFGTIQLPICPILSTLCHRIESSRETSSVKSIQRFIQRHQAIS